MYSSYLNRSMIFYMGKVVMTSTDFVKNGSVVSPGTHLVKNQFLSITNECQLKRARSPKLKILGPLCSQIVKLETDAKTLYYSLVKLKYSPSIYLKHKKD